MANVSKERTQDMSGFFLGHVLQQSNCKVVFDDDIQ